MIHYFNLPTGNTISIGGYLANKKVKPLYRIVLKRNISNIMGNFCFALQINIGRSMIFIDVWKAK